MLTKQPCNHEGGPAKWTHWDLSPGPSACKADVMPLHHVPVSCLPRIRVEAQTIVLRCARATPLGNARLQSCLACAMRVMRGMRSLRRAGKPRARRSVAPACSLDERKATPRGFEPLRAEPNGFRVHLLSHSDKCHACDARLMRLRLQSYRVTPCGENWRVARAKRT